MYKTRSNQLLHQTAIINLVHLLFMKKVETHSVTILKKPVRLSDYALGIFQTINSRAGIKKALKRGLILVDGMKGISGQYIQGGETIDLLIEESKIKKLELNLEVLFEDDYLAIINKPSGIIVSGNKHKTIEHALPNNLQKSPLADALVYPQAAHRLDFPTSGVLLIGKTKTAVTALNKMFEKKEIDKSYYAISIGVMKKEGLINSPIDGKVSASKYEVEQSVISERFGFLNLVKLFPLTGRRHQLRIHLAALGNPILGDKEYGIEGLILQRKGLFLHAFSLQFTHPFTQESIYIEQPLPRKFERIFSS